MPDFMRFILTGVVSVAVAVLLFFLATVGIVVAFGVFLAVFLFSSIFMRRRRHEMNLRGTRFVWYSTPPPAGTAEPDEVHDKKASDAVYELSPDEYSESSQKDNQETKKLV